LRKFQFLERYFQISNDVFGIRALAVARDTHNSVTYPRLKNGASRIRVVQ